MRIAIRTFHFEYAGLDFENTNIKGTTAQVVHGDGFISHLIAVETISQRCGRWFVDHAQNVQASNRAGVLRRLALGIVEVSGDGNN
ncbi:NAD-specific glutamate dehydrogenase-domain-containing protein [Jimgerdemannia flammicorona]|uniref:NAD-specific glutamate dehydrogenase-domain-containing protein n=2 Tax=Jimgerdemannia flammicorona TaxID=994334 RepID=A0A433D0Z5_9FUNG|nr:NAD-specific glutamate dehydrogenase-domain-containing protein [Jimgerdemannia flammicorona]RUS24409.1 NAD-specific glutamate dehydrogenase-domain-containing protein [Jimgerdemannia flammicorona]